MIFIFIAAAAVINIVLGILVLTKGASRVNLGFFMLSFLLAMWNLCVVLWGTGISIAGKFNYIAVALIPAAGMFFVNAIFDVKKGPLAAAPAVILAPGAAIALFTAGTMFMEPLKQYFDTIPYRLVIFGYLFLPLIFAFGVLIVKYHGIKYKQEKTKVFYIITAFLILFFGGMVDLASGAKIIKAPFDYIGNLCNMVYAVIIFTAIFRMRLFNAEVLFGGFLSYAFMAFAAGSLFFIAEILLQGMPLAMGTVFFMLMFVVIYYAARIRGFVFQIREKIGALSKTEEARREYKKITADQAEEGIKILDTLLVLGKYLELSAAVYMKGGDYYMAAWMPGGSGGRDIVEGSSVGSDIILRYETSDAGELDLLDRFGADVLLPLVYSGTVIGALVGKKNGQDISMSQDEVDLLREAGATLAVYMKSKLVQSRQVDDENMKRLGMMADQMAHEIKNPLTALGGAAMLIEGKNDADRENLGIIRDEISRLRKILDSWRDYSREMALDKKPVDLAVLALEAAAVVKLHDAGAEITVSPEFGVEASADRERVKQVLLNVLLNAVEACAAEAKPVVSVTISKKDRYADIKVRDNGEGISKNNLPRVKEALFTSKPKGSGLGLAISEKILKAHGGAMLLDSDGSSYTEVTLSIPLR